MLLSQATHENVLKSNKKTLLIAEQTSSNIEKVTNGKRPTAWLLLQPDLVVFLLLSNLRKTCTKELVSRTSHRVVADDMAGVATIETESIVPTMLTLGFRLWLEPSVVDLHQGMEIDLHRGITRLPI